MKTNRGLITTCELDNNFSLALSSHPPLFYSLISLPHPFSSVSFTLRLLFLSLSLLSIRLHTFNPWFPTLFAFLFSLARCHSPLPPSLPVHSSFSLSLRFCLLFPASLDLSPSCLLPLLLSLSLILRPCLSVARMNYERTATIRHSADGCAD